MKRQYQPIAIVFLFITTVSLLGVIFARHYEGEMIFASVFTEQEETESMDEVVKNTESEEVVDDIDENTEMNDAINGIYDSMEIVGVGNLISDNNDEKYKISIELTTENGESETIEIYLDNSLKIGDYIDFKTKTVVRADGTIENVDLPELLTYEDYTKIEVLTEIKPSKIEVEYTGYTLEGD